MRKTVQGLVGWWIQF